jgi:hypothetical protein
MQHPPQNPKKFAARLPRMVQSLGMEGAHVVVSPFDQWLNRHWAMVHSARWDAVVTVHSGMSLKRMGNVLRKLKRKISPS